MTFRFSLRQCLSYLLFSALLIVGASSRAQALAEAGSALAKFEPARGCYIGAFIERDFTVQGDIKSWEAFTKKKHASYFTYVGYGRPFPSEWVEKIKRNGASPHIAFEPNDGLDEVADGPYLRAWARDAARAKCPIFLRWASEMNGPWMWKGYFSGREKEVGNPAQYIEKFRLMSKVMKEEAPNVAMLWTPFSDPQRFITEYYPGDEWVDWVGVNIYSVYVNNGDPFRPAAQKDPVEALKFVYETYAPRKPIHISEFAATVYCKGTESDTASFAVDKMTRFYGALIRQFPRVKSVNWFCWDTIRARRANNNYSIIDDGRVLAAYRKLVASPHFLSQVSFDNSDWPRVVRAGTTLGEEGIVLRAAGGTDEILSGTGAIAATLTQPMLLGLEPGAKLKTDLAVRVQLPVGFVPRGLMWQIDGRTFALTNVAPFSISIPRERIGLGKHTARVVVLTKEINAKPIASPEIEFEVVE